MTSKRTFIAIDISEPARAACNDHVDALRRAFANVRVGWERPEKIHMTLKFLGATDDSVLERLTDGVPDIAAKYDRFNLRLTGPGVFPSKTKPRILWIGVEDHAGALAKIQPDVERFCSRLGFEKDDRPYRPHLTVGRVREPQNAARLADAHLDAQIEPVEFEVADIVIYESKLQPTGSVYSVIARPPLGARSNT
jgi:2'-5' RNA ligase